MDGCWERGEEGLGLLLAFRIDYWSLKESS